MYTEHFGFDRAVFDSGIAQNDDLFLGKRQHLVAANLKIGLTTRDSVVTLTGALGAGKTTIAAQALRITATRLAQTWLGKTQLTPDEMLETLLAGFELEPYDMGRVQRIQTWRQFMGEMSATDTRLCILVENALELGVEGLRALEALTAADPNDCPGANLVLMGPADLLALLDEPTLAPLKQRVRSRQRLDPMTVQEVEQYLAHRIAYAGGDYDSIVAPGTAAMVHCFSAGLPRVINNVCETGLSVAAAKKQTTLTPEIVKRVAEGVYGLSPTGKLPEISIAPVQKPVVAPAVAVQQAAEKPAPPAQPATVEKATPAPKAPPVAEVPPAVQKPVPAAEPAPIAMPLAAKAPQPEPPAPPPAPAESANAPKDAPAPADDEEWPEDLQALFANPESLIDRGDAKPNQASSEAQLTPAVAKAENPKGQAQEPPVLMDALVDDVAQKQQELAAEPPVLADRVDFDMPIEIKDMSAAPEPPMATLPPDAPKLPESETPPDDDFSEDFASATHLHEISDEMAELLFSADPKASATGVFKAAMPIEDDEDDPPAPATSTLVF